jgi:hypothetical protein
MSKRPRIGDILEIPLPGNGLGYAQYTHKHAAYGALLRVFDVREKVTNFSSLFANEILFSTFFPLSAALNQNILSVASNQPLPAAFQPFPVFRAGVQNKQGKVEVWWLWDGVKEWRVGTLSDEEMKFPIRGVINDTLLIERIRERWRG